MKFEFIATGSIVSTNSLCLKEQEDCFVIQQSFVVSIQKKRNVQQIRTFSSDVVELITCCDIYVTFVLSIPSDMSSYLSSYLMENFKKQPYVMFENKKFYVTSYNLEDLWTLECLEM